MEVVGNILVHKKLFYGGNFKCTFRQRSSWWSKIILDSEDAEPERWVVVGSAVQGIEENTRYKEHILKSFQRS